MSTPFLAEIKIVSFDFAPRGWALCDGQLLYINQNPALFALLGTTYGGNGVTRFALPDLRGRVPIHFGNGFVQGENFGEEAHTLTQGELPAHTHTVAASSNTADQVSPAGNFWANGGVPAYSGAATTALNPASVGNAYGGGQPHNNMSPYLVLNFIIALQGVFPSQD
jgi:microcystin-dependent protein